MIVILLRFSIQLLCGWLTAFCLIAGAQAQECADETTVAGLRVRSVTLNSRFGREPQGLKDLLSRHRGESYTSEKSNQYIAEVRKFVAENQSEIDDAAFGLSKLIKFSIRAKFYDVCPRVVEEAKCRAEFKDDPTPVTQCVDAIVRTTAVQLDVLNVSSNLLPIPRSNRLNFYREIPKPLLAFNPTFGVHHDRATGASPYFGVSTDLLDLRRTLFATKSTGAQHKRDTQVLLDLFGQKSTNEAFYNATARLSLRRTRLLSTVERAAFDASFDAINQPRANGSFLSNVARFGGSVSIRLPRRPITRVILNGKYRWSSNRLFSNSGSLAELTGERAFEGRAIADGRISNGFTRLAIWFDGARPDLMPAHYRRLTAVAGYEKEIPVATNQTVGLEAIFGAGRAWGDVPEYARFYGGSGSGNFLFDEVDSPSLTASPSGPLLRSFGHDQAGIARPSLMVRGGTSYWHTNLNISLPIPLLSRPLIPAEDVGAGTLKQVLKGQVSSGKTLFIKSEARRRLTSEQQAALRLDENDALTPEEREALRKATEAYNAAQAALMPEADKLWAEITPITSFIADQANLYSIKPLVMFDATRISATGFSNGGRTRFALGAGIQVTVVLAKFEAGYLRTINRERGDQRGNFVARLVFQNLF